MCRLAPTPVLHAVLDGVRDLLSERWAEDAALVRTLREWLWAEGLLRARLLDGKDPTNPDHAKFRDYFDYDEPIRTVPSAIARWPCSAAAHWRSSTPSWCWTRRPYRVMPRARRRPLPCRWPKGRIATHLGWRHAKRAGDALIRKTIAWTWKVKLATQPGTRPVRPAARRGREGGHQGLQREPARPVAGRASGPAGRDGAGPGHPHRREGGGGQRHRQGAGHLHTVYPHEPRKRLGRLAACAWAACVPPTAST